MPDLYVDIQRRGAKETATYPLVSGSEGHSVYASQVLYHIGSTYRFRTPFINQGSPIEHYNRNCLRVIRPQVGFHDLECEWKNTEADDDIDNFKVFNKALRFLFDRPNPRPDIKVRIIIPGVEEFEYQRPQRLRNDVIRAFVALIRENRETGDGNAAMIVVEALEEAVNDPNATRATSIFSRMKGVADTSSSAVEEARPPISEQPASVNEAPRPSRSPNPLLDRWSDPSVQVIHRVMVKGFCTHVSRTENAPTESNTRFRRQVSSSEECLICGCLIIPRTERDIRRHYKEHRQELINLRARCTAPTSETTSARIRDYLVQQSDQAATPLSLEVRGLLATLKMNMPQQAASPQITPQEGEFDEANVDPALQQGQPAAMRDSQDLLPSHLTCIICSEQLPSSAPHIARHYATHQGTYTRLRLELERAEARTKSLITKFDRSGDREQAVRERDAAEALMMESDETAARLLQERDETQVLLSKLRQANAELHAKITALEECDDAEGLLVALTLANEELQAKITALEEAQDTANATSHSTSPASALPPPPRPPLAPKTTKPPRRTTTRHHKPTSSKPTPTTTSTTPKLLLYCPICLKCLQRMSAQVSPFPSLPTLPIQTRTPIQQN